ncbi:DUF948 domain-containing protein [Clostridioides mangenotii]|uniref:DUF948 domain-containing protein n=1 Tax=Metaclostridioides mangenotii TaxID=1540 RepID=UPI001C107119|nr:DUF948 domain-containing protein [Clostridioides mangenotii]MBU5308698.1 DUF948 domain-containing protein [Clostridioides mangenotii]MCR1955038.1 DUF948 domain-containing protein [Clostridioides mangenotii]
MSAWGWQIGAVLVGISALIIAIYIAKLLNSLNKSVEKVYKIVDYNERNIEDIIKNVSSISDNIDTITSYAVRLTGLVNIFKVVKKKKIK